VLTAAAEPLEQMDYFSNRLIPGEHTRKFWIVVRYSVEAA
jgi:hypothetical protein